MEFQPFAVSICNSNKKYPIGTATFYTDLAKYEQNRMIRTTQNLNIFDVKSVDFVSHFWKITSATLKEVLHVKQLMMLRLFIIRLPSFIIPKTTVVWHWKASLKLTYTWAISQVFFETGHTLIVRVWDKFNILSKWLIKFSIIATELWPHLINTAARKHIMELIQ